MSRHTPGPWSAESYGANRELVYRSGDPAHGGGLAIEIEGLNRKANAQLIAAAPELLEALRGLLDVTDNMEDALPVAFNAARAAIAKATGAA